MLFERTLRLAARVLLPCLAACAASAPPGPTIEPPDAGTAAPVPSPTAAPVAAPEATGAPSAAVPSPPDPTIPRPVACIGSGFDLDALFPRKDEGFRRDPDGKIRQGTCGCEDGEVDRLHGNAGLDAIGIEVKLDPETAAPGATVKIAVTFRNLTPAARTVVFERCEGDAALAVEARRGTDRADLAVTGFGCGVSRGCMPQRAAVTLPSNGTVTTLGTYRARVMKMVPPCNEVPVGPLPKGDYTLHVLTPLLFLESPSARSPVPRFADAPLRVGR